MKKAVILICLLMCFFILSGYLPVAVEANALTMYSNVRINGRAGYIDTFVSADGSLVVIEINGEKVRIVQLKNEKVAGDTSFTLDSICSYYSYCGTAVFFTWQRERYIDNVFTSEAVITRFLLKTCKTNEVSLGNKKLSIGRQFQVIPDGSKFYIVLDSVSYIFSSDGSLIAENKELYLSKGYLLNPYTKSVYAITSNALYEVNKNGLGFSSAGYIACDARATFAGETVLTDCYGNIFKKDTAFKRAVMANSLALYSSALKLDDRYCLYSADSTLYYFKDGDFKMTAASFAAGNIRGICSYEGKTALIAGDRECRIYLLEKEEIISADKTPDPKKPADTPDDGYIPDGYTLNAKKNIITGISAGTTVAAFKKKLASGLSAEFTDWSGRKITVGKLGTGASIRIYKNSGEELVCCKVVIYGELTGEGNINGRDINTVMAHISEKSELDGVFLYAADLDGDGAVSAKEMLLISRMSG